MNKKGVVIAVGILVITTAIALTDINFDVAEKLFTGFSEKSQVAAVMSLNGKLSTDTSTAAQVDLREDSIQGLTDVLIHQKPASAPSNGSGTNGLSITQAAKEREIQMIALAKLDAEAFLGNVLPDSLRDALPAAVKEDVEKKVTISGKIDVVHVDDFKNPDNSSFQYSLKSNGQKYDVYFAGDVPAIQSGSQVKVKGYQVENVLVAQGDPGGVSILATPTITDATGPQKTLFILVKGPEQPNASAVQVRDAITGGDFKNYYAEQSYGLVSFDGDFTEWISLPQSASYACGAAEVEKPEVWNYLAHHQMSLSKYGRVMFVVNNGIGGCATVGKSTRNVSGVDYTFSTGWSGFESNWNQRYSTRLTNFAYMLSHEMGHELGVMHANAWACTGPSLDVGCAHEEYGNRYDVMGTHQNGAHFNAYYKELLGWLPSSRTSVTQSGTYALQPLEESSGIRAVAITNPYLAGNPAVGPLYVEYRKSVGFDSLLESSDVGLHINQVVPLQRYTRLINANYTKNSLRPWEWHPVLTTGSNFSYPGRGISIGSVSVASSSAGFAVQIENPTCTTNPFQILMPSQQLTVETFGYVQLQIRNQDSSACTPSEIAVSASISGESGWTINTPQPQGDVYPGEERFASVNFFPPPGISGFRTLTITIVDRIHNRPLTETRTLQVASPPSVFLATPTSGPSPLTVSFTAKNLGRTTHTLNFGDGTSESFTPNAPAGAPIDWSPAHVYTSNGTYTAKLSDGTKEIGSVVITATELAVRAHQPQYNSGDTIQVSWTNPGTTYSKDWIGLVIKGKKWADYPGSRAQMWFYTGGAKSGTKTVVAPPVAGEYELVYFINDGYNELLRSAPLSIVVPPPQILFDRPEYNSGDPIVVQWKGLATGSKDWIGLVIENKEWTDYPGSRSAMWFYTDGKSSGSKTLTAPPVPGRYQLAYLPDDGLTIAHRSSAFDVKGSPPPQPPEVIIDAPAYNPGQTITVVWTNPSSAKQNDWVGIVAQGKEWKSAPDLGEGKTWAWAGTGTKGTRTLTAPNAAGIYEVAYFSNDGTGSKLVARSFEFAVIAPPPPPPSGSSIATDQPSYASGGTIKVSWSNSNTPLGGDWAALVVENGKWLSAPNAGEGKTWFWIGGAGIVGSKTGSKTLVAPSADGRYQIVYFSNSATNGTPSELMRSAAFTVGTVTPPPPPPPNSCSLDGVVVPHGSSATFYSVSSVANGLSCASFAQVRTCTNGVLSGSATFSKADCVVQPPPPPPPASSVSTDKSGYVSGEKMAVTWSATGPKSKDWIAITLPQSTYAGQFGGENVGWLWTGGAMSGSKTLVAPASGQYQVVFYSSDTGSLATSVETARSATVNVSAAPKSNTESPSAGGKTSAAAGSYLASALTALQSALKYFINLLGR